MVVTMGEGVMRCNSTTQWCVLNSFRASRGLNYISLHGQNFKFFVESFKRVLLLNIGPVRGVNKQNCPCDKHDWKRFIMFILQRRYPPQIGDVADFFPEWNDFLSSPFLWRRICYNRLSSRNHHKCSSYSVPVYYSRQLHRLIDFQRPRGAWFKLFLSDYQPQTFPWDLIRPLSVL